MHVYEHVHVHAHAGMQVVSESGMTINLGLGGTVTVHAVCVWGSLMGELKTCQAPSHDSQLA